MLPPIDNSYTNSWRNETNDIQTTEDRDWVSPSISHTLANQVEDGV